MQLARLCAFALPLAWAGLACGAQPAAAPSAAAPAPAASAVPAAPATNVTGTAVIEDDRVRIEETRRRGDPQRITVRAKGGGSYEIVVAPAGKDPSQDRGAAGKSTWSVLDF